jgi:hypothetical protein
MSIETELPAFTPLPPKEELLKALEAHKQHLVDLTTYLWYIMPLADKFGDRVYDVAAQSLAKSGIPASADQLKALAGELQTPEGRRRYAKNRRTHIGSNITSYKETDE